MGSIFHPSTMLPAEAFRPAYPPFPIVDSPPLSQLPAWRVARAWASPIMHSPSAPVPASVRVSKVEKMLIDFYRLYKPERETRVPTIVAEFVRRGGGDSELAALNEELRQVYGKDLDDVQCILNGTRFRASGRRLRSAFESRVGGQAKCSSNELRERLNVFYSLWSPERSSRIEVIIRAFEQRGGDHEALKELNAELKEVYGQDLNGIRKSPITTPLSADKTKSGILRACKSDSVKSNKSDEHSHASTNTHSPDEASRADGRPARNDVCNEVHLSVKNVPRADKNIFFRSSLSPGGMTKSGFLSSAFLGGALERARREKEEREKPVKNSYCVPHGGDDNHNEAQDTAISTSHESSGRTGDPEASNGELFGADFVGSSPNAKIGSTRSKGFHTDLEDEGETESRTDPAVSITGDVAGMGSLMERQHAARPSPESKSWGFSNLFTPHTSPPSSSSSRLSFHPESSPTDRTEKASETRTQDMEWDGASKTELGGEWTRKVENDAARESEREKLRLKIEERIRREAEEAARAREKERKERENERERAREKVDDDEMVCRGDTREGKLEMRLQTEGRAPRDEQEKKQSDPPDEKEKNGSKVGERKKEQGKDCARTLDLEMEQNVGIVIHERIKDHERVAKKGSDDLLARAQAELEKAKAREKERRLREEQLSARFKAEAERARQRAKQEIALRAAGVSLASFKKKSQEAVGAGAGVGAEEGAEQADEDEDAQRQRFLLQVLSNTASADLRKDTPVPSPLLPARKRGVEDAHVPDTVSPLSSTKNLLGSASGADSKGVCGTSIISDQMDYVHLRTPRKQDSEEVQSKKMSPSFPSSPLTSESEGGLDCSKGVPNEASSEIKSESSASKSGAVNYAKRRSRFIPGAPTSRVKSSQNVEASSVESTPSNTVTLDDRQVRGDKAVGDRTRARSSSRGLCPACSKIVLGNQDRVKVLPPKDENSEEVEQGTGGEGIYYHRACFKPSSTKDSTMSDAAKIK